MFLLLILLFLLLVIVIICYEYLFYFFHEYFCLIADIFIYFVIINEYFLNKILKFHFQDKILEKTEYFNLLNLS